MKQDKSSGNIALITGCSILLMAVLAALSFGYAHSQLLGSPTLQFSQVKSLLWLETLGWLGIVICDAIVSYGVYLLFRSRHHSLALATGIVRLIYTLFLLAGTAILFYHTLNLTPSIPIESMFFLHEFETVWSIGLIVFGVHLILLGILSVKVKAWYWGQLLIVAGISYSFIHTAQQVVPSATWIGPIETFLSIPMALGELGFAIWLISVGRKHFSKRPEFHK